ncbi:MAG: hypothetical protein ABIK60_01375 [candidate division WOR-3 bacterium]
MKNREEIVKKDFKEVVYLIFTNFQKPFLKEVIEKDIPSNEKKTGKITYRQFIEKQSEKDRLWIDSNFYKNFGFYNTSQKIDKQIENFESFLKEGKLKSGSNKKSTEFSKTLNKLLPSSSDFSNAFFVPIDISELSKIFNNTFYGYDYIFYPILLLIPKAFIEISGVNYVFYSPDIDFSFKVNLRLKKYLEQLQEGKKDKEIFNITWRSILNVLVEQKSFWSLNNMYIISYRRISNEIVEKVEYIGIDKNKAKIIIDDELRDNLNISISMKNEEKKWLIMEYLKRNSLFEICLRYVKDSKKNGDKVKNTSSIFTALAVEENNIKKHKDNYKAFYFEENKRNLISEIKDEIKEMRKANKIFNSLLENNLDYYLINKIKEGRKDKFLNQILKMVNHSSMLKNEKDFNFLLYYIFNKILYNNKSWQYYALPLII